MPKKVTVVTPSKSGPGLWFDYAETARKNAVNVHPVDRAGNDDLMRDKGGRRSSSNSPDGSPWYDDPERNAEGNRRHSKVVEDANAFAFRYPNGKPLDELKAETRAYLAELIEKLA
jgi:hypothetical protein